MHFACSAMKLLAIFAVGALAQFVNTPPYHSIAISQEAGNADAVGFHDTSLSRDGAPERWWF